MDTKTLPLHHLIRKPKKDISNAPALFMLHGYGSNEEDLFSFANELPDELFIISLRAPLTLMPFGYAWYAIHFDAQDGKWSDDEQAKQARDVIAQCIDNAIDQYPIDKNNITLLGFSQGTILSLAVALTYPEKVKNVIGLSGYLNPHIIPENLSEKDYSHLNMFISHGSVDQVIPVDWARKTAPFLKQLDITHEYKEYPVGHGVAPQNFYDLNEWLKKHL